jgi:L-lysine 2,3-aminomutase
MLLSGGDALFFSDDKLEKILSRLRAIPHIEFCESVRVFRFFCRNALPSSFARCCKNSIRSG